MRDSNDRISVLVADSTRMSTELLSSALTRDEQLSVVATVIGSGDLARIAQDLRPDVLVVGMGSHDQPLAGCDIARSVSSFLPDTRIVILLDKPDHDAVVEAFRAGARGVFCRAASINELCKCVHQVHSGQIWAGGQELQFVLDALGQSSSPRLNTKIEVLLSSREQQIVRCVAEGLQNREIAARLSVSIHTVKNYLFRIFDKLGVSNRAELIFLVSSRPAMFATAEAIPAEIPQDPEAAFTWAQKASDRLIEAQMMLAEIYKEGRVVPRDPIQAAVWTSIAEVTCRLKLHAIIQMKERLVASLDPLTKAESDRLTSQWLDSRRPKVVGAQHKSMIA